MSVKTLSEHIDDFVKMAPAEREYLPSTVPHYAHWLYRYADWVGPGVLFDEGFSAERLRAFKKHLIQAKYADSTRSNVHAILRSFGSWLLEEGILDSNPALALGRVKIRQKTPRVALDSDVVTLLDACPRVPCDRKGALARVVLCLMTYAGLRRSEMLALYLTDYVPDPLVEGTYKIIIRHGKGNKYREVPLNSEAQEAVEAWLALRPNFNLKGTDTPSPYLLVQNSVGSLSKSGIYSLLKMIAKVAGIAYTNPHSFRHGEATRLLRLKDQVDHKTVAELMGHEKTSTTVDTYFHTTNDLKRRAVELAVLKRASPPTPPTQPSPAPSPLRIVGE